MEYNGYFIYPDKTGYAQKELKYSFFLDNGEMYCEHASFLESEFLEWIRIKGWQYINPLDIYQHKHKELYKTKSELNEIFLSQRHS
jgi:hypothetical protein